MRTKKAGGKYLRMSGGDNFQKGQVTGAQRVPISNYLSSVPKKNPKDPPGLGRQLAIPPAAGDPKERTGQKGGSGEGVISLEDKLKRHRFRCRK